jgi:hypothetical protein
MKSPKHWVLQPRRTPDSARVLKREPLDAYGARTEQVDPWAARRPASRNELDHTRLLFVAVSARCYTEGWKRCRLGL